MKILIIRTDNIGDMICTIPLFHGLRARYPDATIDVLTNSYVAPILAKNEHLNQVFSYTKGKHSKNAAIKDRFNKVSIYLVLFRRKYDVVIACGKFDLFVLLLSLRSQIIAHDRALSPFLKGLHIIKTPLDTARHEVQRTWALGSPLGLDAQASPPKPTIYGHRITPIVKGTPPLIGVQLSARRPRQRWSLEKYGSLINDLLTETNWSFYVIWSPGSEKNQEHPGDDEMAERLRNLVVSHRVSFVSTRTLNELVTTLARSDGVITPDGGAAHIAGALGLKLVVLFGDSDPSQWAPWKATSVVMRGENKTVESISVRDVKKAIYTLFNDCVESV